MLHGFIAAHRDEIVRRCRAKVAMRSVPSSIDATEMDRGVPVFLGQLVDALHFGLTSSPTIGESAIQHGNDLLRQGFTASQVVHSYGDVCQAITELAGEENAPISTDDFRILNRCLDDTIAGAVTEYGRARNELTIDDETARGTERLGFLAHELRNLVNTAIVAFGVLKSGHVGIAGSTGAVLDRSLTGLRTLIGHSLAEVRLAQGLLNREPLLVTAFIEELVPAARLTANAHEITLDVLPVEDGVVIEADRQVLAAVLTNLLQNACKFTRPRTTVTLRVEATLDRVRFEIEDRCGGLDANGGYDLFRPFEQRSADRTGLGLGLAYSRWGTEANLGRLSARSLPDLGCVFTVDLPRYGTPAGALD